ncbi:MAG: bifunctional (p)ppGpp synthetase/guanosine-3',5'-bis(diphosphate) 3'-pyrophosphohydrolase, partial [Spirochaetales bacterium]
MKYEDRLEDHLERFLPEDLERIHAARTWAAVLHEGELRASGEPEVTHLERTAAILAGMGMDADSVIAGLLHHAMEECKTTRPNVDERFGPRVAELVDEL